MFVRCVFVYLSVSETWKNSRRREAADQSCCHFIFLTLSAARVKWAIQAQLIVTDLPAAAGPDLVLLSEHVEWVCVCDFWSLKVLLSVNNENNWILGIQSDQYVTGICGPRVVHQDGLLKLESWAYVLRISLLATSSQFVSSEMFTI